MSHWQGISHWKIIKPNQSLKQSLLSTVSCLVKYCLCEKDNRGFGQETQGKLYTSTMIWDVTNIFSHIVIPSSSTNILRFQNYCTFSLFFFTLLSLSSRNKCCLCFCCQLSASINFQPLRRTGTKIKKYRQWNVNNNNVTNTMMSNLLFLASHQVIVLPGTSEWWWFYKINGHKQILAFI